MMDNAVTLSKPKSGSWSTTRSAGVMLASSDCFSRLKLSVLSRLSASLRSHTLIVRELALTAGVSGTTMIGRGISIGGSSLSSG